MPVFRDQGLARTVHDVLARSAGLEGTITSDAGHVVPLPRDAGRLELVLLSALMVHGDRRLDVSGMLALSRNYLVLTGRLVRAIGLDRMLDSNDAVVRWAMDDNPPVVDGSGEGLPVPVVEVDGIAPALDTLLQPVELDWARALEHLPAAGLSRGSALHATALTMMTGVNCGPSMAGVFRALEGSDLVSLGTLLAALGESGGGPTFGSTLSKNQLW